MRFGTLNDHEQVSDVFKNEHRKITESTQKDKNTTFSWARDHVNIFSNQNLRYSCKNERYKHFKYFYNANLDFTSSKWFEGDLSRCPDVIQGFQ